MIILLSAKRNDCVLNSHVNSYYCVKSARIRSFSGSYFLAFGLNTDQKNSVYRNFSRSVLNPFLVNVHICLNVFHYSLAIKVFRKLTFLPPDTHTSVRFFRG